MSGTSLYAKDQPEGYSNYIKNVAIVGGGGQIGKHLLEHVLKAERFAVTAIQRNDSTSELPDQIKVLRVDYDNDDSLAEALTGQDALIVTMAVMAPRDTISKLIRAAAKAGVPYILPNWYGHDSEDDRLCRDSLLADRRDAIRDEIKSLGVSSYLFLVCGFWYEFSLGGGPDRYGFNFQKRRLTWFDDGGVRIHTSTWPQCGRAVASLLSLKRLPDHEHDDSVTLSRYSDGPVYISSFFVSQRDMFESVKRVTNTNDSDWAITHDSSQKRWKEGMDEVRGGNFGAFTKMLYSRMFFPKDADDHESSSVSDNAALGLPCEDLDSATAVAIRMGEMGEVAHAH